MIRETSFGDVIALLPTLHESTDCEGITELHSRIGALAASGNRRLIVDLSDTRGCGDDVAGALMAAVGLYRKHGGKVVICGVSKNFMNLLRMTKLDRFIEAYDTEAEAIASFGER